MKILVTGAGGTLGGRIAALLAASFDVVAACRDTPPPVGLRTWRGDLLAPGELEKALTASGCQAVVHAAALANVDACEREPQRAHETNALLPRRLARLCRERALRLVALSTDLVFDGHHAPYTRASDPRPALVYGRTKLEGEKAVLDEAPDGAVMRVALVWGRGHGARGTSSESVLWSLAAGRRVTLFTDQIRTPIDPESLCAAIQALLATRHAGIFHTGGSQRLSRFELGRLAAEQHGLDVSLIVPAEQARDPIGATRPPDVSLDSGGTRQLLSWEPRSPESVLATCRLRPDEAAW